jgi:protein required for attachment to host cells
MSIWIVAADAACARIFQGESLRGEWEEVEDLADPLARHPTEDPPTGEQGRMSGSHGPHRLQPKHSPRGAADIAFARLVCERLRRALDSNRIQAFCLVAAPHFLGLLRQSMDEHLGKALLRDLDKDLSRHTVSEIRQHLLATG